MLITFCFGVSSNLSQQKSTTAEILRIYFLRTIFRRKYMHQISTVVLFCCDKFEETPSEKVVNMSKLTKSYFSQIYFLSYFNSSITIQDGRCASPVVNFTISTIFPTFIQNCPKGKMILRIIMRNSTTGQTPYSGLYFD